MDTDNSATGSSLSDKTEAPDSDDTLFTNAPADIEKLPSNRLNNGSETNYQVYFSGDSDPLSPRSMSTLRKWFITVIVATTSFCVACTSSIYTATLDQIMKEFQVSEIVATLGLSLFVAGLALSPMILAPLSEFYGRKPVYVISLIVYVIWIIPCAVAPNIQTLLVARFFNGFAGAAFLSVAGGTIGDMFSRTQLHLPMMIYTVSPL
jgi:Major Facilitator Superfamily